MCWSPFGCSCNFRAMKQLDPSLGNTDNMYILGLNAYHGDSSACIYRNAELLAATEEERILRVKHWAGLPVEAVRFCLQEAGIGLQDVDFITVSRDPIAKMGQKAAYALRSGVLFRAVRDRARNAFSIRSLKKDLAAAFGLEEKQVKARMQYIEHHRSHLASAFFTSPFEESALLSVDGMGDFSSVMRGVGKGNRIEVMDSISYPHSLGIFYTACTQYLGFEHYGDEYKVMGLAPYGEPKYVDRLRDVVLYRPEGLFELNPKYFKHFKSGVAMSWSGGSPHVEPLYTDALVQALGPVRGKDEYLNQHHKDVAASVQRLCEEVIFRMAQDLYEKTGLKNLCLAGGVAQNSVANGKLTDETGFEHLYVPPAGHDAGTATGSALYLYHHKLRNTRPMFRHQAYTGAQFTDEHVEALLRQEGIVYQKLPDEELLDLVAGYLADGAVVGWFQGRAEFGPRALGNRSILVHPARPDAKDLLNDKIKRREGFRPFAPSILEEAVADYFEKADPVPFMEKVYRIKAEKRSLIPAVTHVDGTGRLQTVSVQDNPRYHALIRRFADKTGVPILLNTSFNENEPIVNTPVQALACYLRTKMDVLVLQNCIIIRK